MVSPPCHGQFCIRNFEVEEKDGILKLKCRSWEKTRCCGYVATGEWSGRIVPE
jgi:hypothetical protein